VETGEGFFRGTYRDDHLVGPFAGVYHGAPIRGAFDDDGRMDGDWTLLDSALHFDHGTGHARWGTPTVFHEERVDGDCVLGLRDGAWRTERYEDVREIQDGREWRGGALVRREIPYDHGVVHGHARVWKYDRLIGEGDVEHGVVRRWRGLTQPGCRAPEDVHGGCVVAHLCHEVIAPFAWSCEFEDSACRALQQITPGGAIAVPPPRARPSAEPKSDDEWSLAVVDIDLARPARCPFPAELVLDAGIGKPWSPP
jgi:hypothetical protein